jgi:hypothetical protein
MAARAKRNLHAARLFVLYFAAMAVTVHLRVILPPAEFTRQMRRNSLDT